MQHSVSSKFPNNAKQCYRLLTYKSVLDHKVKKAGQLFRLHSPLFLIILIS